LALRFHHRVADAQRKAKSLKAEVAETAENQRQGFEIRNCRDERD
jgi:hypothetical protein